MLGSGGKVEDLNRCEQIFFTNGRSNMLRKPNIFSLETIVEEGLAHPELEDEEVLDNRSSIIDCPTAALEDDAKTLDDRQTSLELCHSCEVYFEKQPGLVSGDLAELASPLPSQVWNLSGEEVARLPDLLELGNTSAGQEDMSTREEPIVGTWRQRLEDFVYNLVLSFLPTAWDVISDLRTAEHLKDKDELGFAGLSFLFICLPGLYLILDLFTQKLSKRCGGKVLIVNVFGSVSLCSAMIFLFSRDVLVFKYPAFLVGLGMVGVKGVALFYRTPLMKELSGKVTKFETETESPLQILLLLHIWLSGGPLFLAPIASSLLAIAKVNAEVYLSSKPENLLDGADFLKKLSLIIKFLPLFISTTFFRLGSGIIKHSGPYSSIAEPYSTLFFFFTVWSGTVVYTVLYLIIFYGVKTVFSKQLEEVTLYDGARSVMAEFSSVSLWGNLGRIRSRCSKRLLK